MASFIRNPKEFWAGVIFIFFGLAAVYIGQDYSMGTAGRMGPAYFPTILGGLLAVIGVISLLRSLIKGGEAPRNFAVKGAILVLVGSALFGVLVRQAGLVAAIIVLVMLGGLANAKFRVGPYLLLAVGMAIFCVLVFVKGLGLPMPMVGPWLGA
ncbi:MAG TPA: tripartite tricarboxylate transporter TctB family protein [Noviherbaspirillum sp.]|uniref:tripartite tricarboxylate transporter TctB family protein n=1 Tax=Noviherbaspirillum sp. TaxID=1926288 RepID=UPI002F932023